MLKKCGHVPYPYKHLMHAEFHSNSSQENITTLELAEACIQQHTASPNCKHSCRPGCTQNVYHVSTSFLRSNREHGAYIDMFFPAMVEELLEETPLQTWLQVLSNFGGILGLMTGFSLMSFIEIIIYVGLHVISKY